MGNPWRGEVSLVIDGEAQVLKLTLGALAQLEEALAEGSLVDLVERFEAGRFSSRDVLALIVAGLRGGGWQGGAADLVQAEIAGGPMGAARAAAELLARAFMLPEVEQT
ncbi:gene transfer agent family protein [Marinovum sp.]|uniref:gene transfer agent family protein n=1 Tax=Marinovum sp. TaxID=2024839 RepID=UPI002B278B49|nr:gene transfer agent family protein [Marinovum sp.]